MTQERLQLYYKLEKELTEIASSFGMGAKEFTKAFCEQSNEVRDIVRPILLTQLELLEEMQAHHYAHLENVTVFPISRRAHK